MRRHARRHRRRPAPEIPHPGAVGVDAVVVESVGPEELHPALDVVGDVLRPGEVGLQPLAVGHPERRAVFLLQPAREAEMVGVEMGDDRTLERPVAEPLEHVDPMRLHVVAVPPGIDDGPAVAVLEQIEVDMVEREGKRHLEPVNAGSDLQGLPVFQIFVGVTRLARHGDLLRSPWAASTETRPRTGRSTRIRGPVHSGSRQRAEPSSGLRGRQPRSLPPGGEFS